MTEKDMTCMRGERRERRKTDITEEPITIPFPSTNRHVLMAGTETIVLHAGVCIVTRKTTAEDKPPP